MKPTCIMEHSGALLSTLALRPVHATEVSGRVVHMVIPVVMPDSIIISKVGSLINLRGTLLA